MDEVRVDRIEEALGELSGKVDALGVRLGDAEERLDTRISGLDVKIDAVEQRLDAKIEDGFRQVAEAFDEQRKFTIFAVQQSETTLRTEMREGFDRLDRRFDRLEERLFREE